jgi:pyridoxamine 5'-phosphate oxidase
MRYAQDPIKKFQRIFKAAAAAVDGDHTAGTLATATASGRPSARVILLKSVNQSGFLFFTNYKSRKAKEIETNPYAALCFYWRETGRQVRIEGKVARAPEEESTAYFATRSRKSQVGAWASHQSQPLERRRDLVARFIKLQAQFGRQPVPRPEFWGGYLLSPCRIEFWTNREYRLHDRVVYERQETGWTATKLNP